jgi:hypothetical protein
MTDFTVDDVSGKMRLLLVFMETEHADPVDRLVVRALRLYWKAYAIHHGLPRHTTASLIACNAEAFATVVLVKVQNQKHYDVLEPIVGAAKDRGIFFDALGMNSSPSVTENVAHYDAILDLSEKTLDSEELKGPIPKLEIALYEPVFTFGAMEHIPRVTAHEVLPASHELAHQALIDREGASFDDLPTIVETPLDVLIVASTNSEAYADFMDGDADRARFFDRLRSVPFRSFNRGTGGISRSDGPAELLSPVESDEE